MKKLVFGILTLLYALAMFFLFSFYWLTGVKIDINTQGKKVGYIRWFTFYRA